MNKTFSSGYLAKAAGISPTTANKYIDALAKYELVGSIQRKSSERRSVTAEQLAILLAVAMRERKHAGLSANIAAELKLQNLMPEPDVNPITHDLQQPKGEMPEPSDQLQLEEHQRSGSVKTTPPSDAIPNLTAQTAPANEDLEPSGTQGDATRNAERRPDHGVMVVVRALQKMIVTAVQTVLSFRGSVIPNLGTMIYELLITISSFVVFPIWFVVQSVKMLQYNLYDDPVYVRLPMIEQKKEYFSRVWSASIDLIVSVICCLMVVTYKPLMLQMMLRIGFGSLQMTHLLTALLIITAIQKTVSGVIILATTPRFLNE